MRKLLLTMILLTLSISVSTSSFAKEGWLCSAEFVSSDGYIATASHCVGNTMEVYYKKDGAVKSADAKLVAIDKEHDVALLKIDEHQMPYFTFDYNYQIGDKITVWGWPNVNVYGMSLKHYSGRITSLDEKSIYIYSFIAHGMSGGALVDMDGRQIGVTVAGLFSGMDEGSTEQGVITRIEYLQLLMIQQGVITLPTIGNDNTPNKMVFLTGTNE